MRGDVFRMALAYLVRLHYFGEEVPAAQVVREIQTATPAGGQTADKIIDWLIRTNALEVVDRATFIWRR